jgi:hypothetical protein
MKHLLPAAVFTLATTTLCAQETAFPPPRFPEAPPATIRNIQRSMRLLATSTPETRNTVRILFYGQSITAQKWTKAVTEDLEARFPHANLIIQNRAIGGHASQLLVKTAEADLYPFQPDLLIFHVYGAHDKYEDIIRQVRERTCAEILQQNDHVTAPEHLTEQTDASKLAPGKGNWDAFMNHNFLPKIANTYGTAYCDQRAFWKQYLAANNLKPSALLKDTVHLNAHGEYLMGEIVKAHLRYEPKLGRSPAEDWVRTIEIGRDVQWQDGKLTLPFNGNRIDAILRPGAPGSADVTIDGRKPSQTREAHAFTRTSKYPGSNWPCLLKVGSEAQLQEEEWTLTLRNVSADMASFDFDLSGSVTGADGSGSRGERFVSKSSRVVIDPSDWNFDYCMKVFRKPVTDGFQVTWKAVLRGTDKVTAPTDTAPGKEASTVLAQGLANGAHTLELTGGPTSPITAFRVYEPPLKPRQ